MDSERAGRLRRAYRSSPTWKRALYILIPWMVFCAVSFPFLIPRTGAVHQEALRQANFLVFLAVMLHCSGADKPEAYVKVYGGCAAAGIAVWMFWFAVAQPESVSAVFQSPVGGVLAALGFAPLEASVAALLGYGAWSLRQWRSGPKDADQIVDEVVE